MLPSVTKIPICIVFLLELEFETKMKVGKIKIHSITKIVTEEIGITKISRPSFTTILSILSVLNCTFLSLGTALAISTWFVLFEAIECQEDEVLGVSLASATFPNSWYNLSETTKNNLFTFIEGGTTYNTLIPDGNYNILELMVDRGLREYQDAQPGFQ